MDDLITEEPPSFSSKIKMETLLATFQLPQHVNDQDTLPSVLRWTFKNIPKGCMAFIAYIWHWHLLYLWSKHTIIYANYNQKSSGLKPWLYELLRSILTCLPMADEMAITKQSRFYLEHVV